MQNRTRETGELGDLGIGVQRVAVAGEAIDQRLILACVRLADGVGFALGDLMRLGRAGIGAAEAAVAARMLKPKYIVPAHYGTSPALTGTPEMLKEELAKQKVVAEVVVLRPGETLA